MGWGGEKGVGMVVAYSIFFTARREREEKEGKKTLSQSAGFEKEPMDRGLIPFSRGRKREKNRRPVPMKKKEKPTAQSAFIAFHPIRKGKG